MNDSVHASPRRGDRISGVTQAVEKAEAELTANPTFGPARHIRQSPADKYAWQAVELSLLPEGKARRGYVERFYWHSRIDIHTGEAADRGTAVKAWALPSSDLGLWLLLRNNRAFKTAEEYRDRAHANPLHRHFWAVISVASATAQEIRALDPLAVEAFAKSATGRVNVDKELASLTTQLLGASAVREKIGSEPLGDTSEIQHARTLWLRHIEDLDTKVVQPALERITALCEYRDRLRALQSQTATVYRISKSEGIDEQLGELVRQSGHDIDGSSRIDSSATELRQAEIARSTALAEVRGDYLNALLPSQM
ncbi:MAG: hypothetical protein WAW17_11010 [Rhodococcus sp. (in: high G+C Gram-positive bacteria)]|uniref:hypothetical protein n=1 Tax=Rhodococcus sp. TaxID=1831 RepID=UPI003BAED5BB